jgi:hypothetical protein
LVSNDGSLILADFCGSILDSSIAIVAPLLRYYRPITIKDRLLNICISDDLFALGVVLYEIAVECQIWEGKDDREVTMMYEKGQFPDLKETEARLARVIKKCWEDQYENADKMQVDYAQ